MTPLPTFKPDDIELVPDAWGRFERATDAVVKGGPQHKVKGMVAESHSSGDGHEGRPALGSCNQGQDVKIIAKKDDPQVRPQIGQEGYAKDHRQEGGSEEKVDKKGIGEKVGGKGDEKESRSRHKTTAKMRER